MFLTLRNFKSYLIIYDRPGKMSTCTIIMKRWKCVLQCDYRTFCYFYKTVPIFVRSLLCVPTPHFLEGKKNLIRTESGTGCCVLTEVLRVKSARVPTPCAMSMTRCKPTNGCESRLHVVDILSEEYQLSNGKITGKSYAFRIYHLKQMYAVPASSAMQGGAYQHGRPQINDLCAIGILEGWPLAAPTHPALYLAVHLCL